MTQTLPARAVVLATAVLAVGTLAACGNGLSTSRRSSEPAIVDGPSASASPQSPPASPPASPPESSPVVQSSPVTATVPVSAPRRSTVCGPGDLVVGLRTPRGGGTAGSQYELLRFRNTSASTCTMNGHPGVSFVGKGNGTQLGAPAARTGALRTVRLAPGRSATALLQIVNAGNYDPAECAPTTSDGLRVYPPDWRVSVFVPFRTQACQLDPGTSPQLTVSAVG